MDTTRLRAAYDTLAEVAATASTSKPAEGGWDAEHILAHMLSVDAGIAAAALEVTAGGRATFDNRISHDTWNLDRIVAEHADRDLLIRHVHAQGMILSDIADQLSDESSSVLVPALLLSNDKVVVDEPVPLAELIAGLADNHIPQHTQQLRDLPLAALQDIGALASMR